MVSRRTLLGSVAGLVGCSPRAVAVASAREGPAGDGLLARRQITAAAEPLPPVDDAGFAALVDRFADAKVILLGESTHDADAFYRARAAITERLVREHGFDMVAIEADWPDAARIDAHVRGRDQLPPP